MAMVLVRYHHQRIGAIGQLPPAQWSNNFFENLFGYEYEPDEESGGGLSGGLRKMARM
ncbi:MAG: hypothetical protein R2688_02645 [Fimbriimonadaceae bacterium]